MTETSGGGFRVRRFLLGGGNEPDPRFTLANERTFLAWIRTALAVIATAVAADTLMVSIWPTSLRKAIVVVLLLGGTVLSAGAGFRWLGVERALRHGGPLPLSSLAPILVLAVLFGAAGALGFMVWPRL
jgi:putative membrane protein